MNKVVFIYQNAYYKYCNLFTLPSKKEGFCIVYLEATQYKKPVITVNYGVSTDVILDGETGFLYAYDDQHAFMEKINCLYMDFIKFKTLEENGYKRLIDNFTFNNFKSRLASLLIKEKSL